MDGFYLLAVILAIVLGSLVGAWYWATYGLNEFLAALIVLAVFVALMKGGLSLIDGGRPPPTIPRGLT